MYYDTMYKNILVVIILECIFLRKSNDIHIFVSQSKSAVSHMDGTCIELNDIKWNSIKYAQRTEVIFTTEFAK